MEIRPTPRKQDLTADRSNAAETLAIAEAVALAVSDPNAVLDVILRCEDDAEASQALQRRFRVDAAQADAMLNLSFRRVTRTMRARITAQAREARAFLDSDAGSTDS